MPSMPAVILAGLIVTSTLFGCTSGPEPTFDGPVYPPDAVKLETLNIQAQIGETDITLTSGIARNPGPVTVWLNRWFATDINGLDPGQRLVLPLARFRNESGLAPRAGGFFATRDRDEIVLVELRTDQGMHGVHVLGER